MTICMGDALLSHDYSDKGSSEIIIIIITRILIIITAGGHMQFYAELG